MLIENDKKTVQQKQAYSMVKVPATVTIKDRDYITNYWGIEGFELRGFEEKLQVGDCLSVRFRASFAESLQVDLPVVVEVVWEQSQHQAAGFHFINLDRLGEMVLSNLVDYLHRQDQVAREALPYKVNKLSFLEPEEKKQHRKPIRVGSVILLVAAASAGIALFNFAVNMLYDAVIFVEVKTATIQRPVEQVISAHRGKITSLTVREGTKVKEGQPLLTLFDQQMALYITQDQVRGLDSSIEDITEQINRLEEKIALSRTLLELNEARLSNARQRLWQEKEKIGYAWDISQDRVEAARAKLESLQIQRQEITALLLQYESIFKQGALQERQVKLLRAKVAKIDGDIKVARQELEIAQKIASAAKKGKFYNGERFVGELPELQAAVRDATFKVEAAKKELAAYQAAYSKRQSELANLRVRKHDLKLHQPTTIVDGNFTEETFSTTYRAPLSGTILKVNISEGSTLNIGKLLMLIGKDTDSTIVQAYLTQDQAIHLAVGDSVTITLPEQNVEYKAKVKVIDRRGGFFDEVRAKYQYEGSVDNSAYVEIALSSEAARELPPGTLVKVKFRKKLDKLIDVLN
ncbi:MAG: HlyD family secretion protein [Prochloraceae cyanobacterium]